MLDGGILDGGCGNILRGCNFCAGDTALDHPPPEVFMVLDEDEGSSSEDTSDEAYIERHRIQEEEEQKKFMAIQAGVFA